MMLVRCHLSSPVCTRPGDTRCMAPPLSPGDRSTGTGHPAHWPRPRGRRGWAHMGQASPHIAAGSKHSRTDSQGPPHTRGRSLGSHGRMVNITVIMCSSPVMVSGLGTRPGRHLQMGLPSALGLQEVPGPQGLGSHGSGLSTHRWSLHTRPYSQSGSITHSGPHPGDHCVLFHYSFIKTVSKKFLIGLWS